MEKGQLTQMGRSTERCASHDHPEQESLHDVTVGWGQHQAGGTGQKGGGCFVHGNSGCETSSTALQGLTQAQEETEWINEGKDIKLQTTQSPSLSYRVLSSHSVPQILGFGHCHRQGPNKPGAGAHRTNFITLMCVPVHQTWVNWDY